MSNHMNQLMNFGGPAYPCNLQGKPMANPLNPLEVKIPLVPVPGMSLHHFFAGQALAGIDTTDIVDGYHHKVAECCIQMADAMLEAYNNKIEGMEKNVATKS